MWGCARHAQIGSTCCQHSEILVTDGDRARIAAHLGIPDGPAPHIVREHPVDLNYELDPADPDWALGFWPDGSRPVLARRPNGDCTFLGAAGCTLPMDVRPLICRIFPYEMDGERLTGLSSRCPAEVVPAGSSIVDVLDMNASVAEGWRSQLYAELREAPRRPAEGR